MRIVLLAVLLSSVLGCGPATRRPNSPEIVIAGAGTGGVAAAVQAARLGAKVTLVEETDWVGGQMTAAGVSMMDEGNAGTRYSGIYAEFISRVRGYYADRDRFAIAKPLERTSYFGYGIGLEPHVGRKVLLDMLADVPKASDGSPGVRLLTRRRILGVVREGALVEGLIVCDKHDPRCRLTPVPEDVPRETLPARVVIDATEFGDLLPLAGVRYRLGNVVSDALDEAALDGRCIQDITYTAVIRKYQEIPDSLRIKAPPPGYEEVAPQFRATGMQNVLPWNWENHTRYRAMPDSLNPQPYTADQPTLITKTGLNWANDYPAGVGLAFLPLRYIEDPEFRRASNCKAKLRTLNFLYFVQAELQQPWSLATEEGYDSPYNVEENLCPEIPEELKELERHLPVMPYVRESRRAIGVNGFTLSAPTVRRVGSPARAQQNLASSIAIADYQNDLHGCNQAQFLESDLESDADVPKTWNVGPFQVPIETLVPEGIHGLVLAEKNLAQSRLVNGATRLQPSTMHTGQAAGALAAIAARANLPPAVVPALWIQKQLVSADVPLSLAAPYRAPWTTGYDLSDVPPTSASWGAVQLVTTLGIMSPIEVGRFGMWDALPRAHAAVALSRFLGVRSTLSSPPHFLDVPSTHPEFAYIEGLVEACILSASGEFFPDQPITREQLARFIVKGLSRCGENDAVTMSDDDSVQWLLAENTPSLCNALPFGACAARLATRGDAALMFARALNQWGDPRTASGTASTSLTSGASR